MSFAHDLTSSCSSLKISKSTEARIKLNASFESLYQDGSNMGWLTFVGGVVSELLRVKVGFENPSRNFKK